MAVSRRIRDAAHYQAIVREDDYFRALAELSLINKGIKNPTALQIKIEMSVLAHKYPRSSIFLADISKQETNCLLLTSWGFEVEEIAQTLELQPDSVLKIRARTSQKLNAKNIPNAVYKANHAGILRCDNADFILLREKTKAPILTTPTHAEVENVLA